MKNLNTSRRSYQFEDDKLNQELDRIWSVLSILRIYPMWRIYANEEGEAHIQLYNSTTKQYISKVKFDKDGNFTTLGTHTPSTAITSIGKA